MTKHNKSNNKTTRKKRGGKVIGSGGYGCVFRPALKCKTAKKRLRGRVSKLLTKKHARVEKKTINRILKVVKYIPNYKEYFIIDDVTMCEPATLTRSDLANFDKKCSVFEKHDKVTKRNINDNLKKYYMLNLPDGGISLAHYYNEMSDLQHLKYINAQLINLLANGVVPLNDAHMYHADIKESNVLYDTTTHKVGLIDWGLSFSYKRGKIPTIIRNKPLQYNHPFSVILFNKTFDSMYSEILSEHNQMLSRRDLYDFLIDYIRVWREERGDGHYQSIVDIWKHVAGTEYVIEEIIVPYLAEILTAYTSQGRFHSSKYFANVFLRNVDVWGFLMTYSPILETNVFDRRSPLVEIYKRHLLARSTEPIDVNEVMYHLMINL